MTANVRNATRRIQGYQDKVMQTWHHLLHARRLSTHTACAVCHEALHRDGCRTLHTGLGSRTSITVNRSPWTATRNELPTPDDESSTASIAADAVETVAVERELLLSVGEYQTNCRTGSSTFHPPAMPPDVFVPVAAASSQSRTRQSVPPLASRPTAAVRQVTGFSCPRSTLTLEPVLPLLPVLLLAPVCGFSLTMHMVRSALPLAKRTCMRTSRTHTHTCAETHNRLRMHKRGDGA